MISKGKQALFPGTHKSTTKYTLCENTKLQVFQRLKDNFNIALHIKIKAKRQKSLWPVSQVPATIIQ